MKIGHLIYIMDQFLF